MSERQSLAETEEEWVLTLPPELPKDPLQNRYGQSDQRKARNDPEILDARQVTHSVWLGS